MDCREDHRGRVERDEVALVPVMIPRSAAPKKSDCFSETYRNRRISMRLRSLRRAENATDKSDNRVGVASFVASEIICTRKHRDCHQDGIAGDGNVDRLRWSARSLSILLTLRTRTLWYRNRMLALIDHWHPDMTIGTMANCRIVAVQVITAGGPCGTGITGKKRQQAQR